MAATLLEKKVKSKKESCSYSAPDAENVELAGNFTEWDKHPIKMRKLNEKNLSNLTPHPLYSGFYYSHPTLLERERALTATVES